MRLAIPSPDVAAPNSSRTFRRALALAVRAWTKLCLWKLAIAHFTPRPRRSARMTHLCSDRVTHTKNTICPRARRGQQFHPRRQACGLFFCHPRRRRVKCSARGKASVRRGKPTTAPLLAKRFAPALPVGKTGVCWRQRALHFSVVLGNFWRAKYGHFSRLAQAPRTLHDERRMWLAGEHNAPLEQTIMRVGSTPLPSRPWLQSRGPGSDAWREIPAALENKARRPGSATALAITPVKSASLQLDV